MEIVISIAAKIAQYTVEPVGQCLGYLFYYSSNIQNMKKQVDKLQGARGRVQHSIDAAIRDAEEIEADVKMWLENVDVIMGKVKEVLEDEENAKMRSFNGACLNLKLRHQQSKKAKKMVQDIEEVLNNGSFDKVSFRPPSQATMTTTYRDYMTFESRMSIVEQLMDALGDANINVIGVWGMPGVGKTTLVREVAKQVMEKKIFNEVAIAEVTQNLDLRRIQGELADMLDLKIEKETVRGRAIRLQERLSKHNKILVILDDIWDKLDLEEVGIPSKCCKVVVTSRNQDILSCEIGTQKNFGLDVLRVEEAWSLFEMMAGESVKDPNLRPTATVVAKECAGLPIALVTVSKALKNKSLYEWKDALRLLRRPAAGHLSKMQSTIYSSIELSYSHLESQEAQIFLLCSQMGNCISRLDLLKYSYGWCLSQSINTLEDARNRLYKLVRNLRDSCLLLDCPRSHEHFHMHDVVRDVAIFIASKDHNMFMVGDGGEVKEWPNVDALKRCTALSIFGGDVRQLPEEMECPRLRLFYVNGGNHSLQITQTFFKGMGELNVLDLTEMKLSSLPSSLNLLRNLQTLCLDRCVLGDIAIIGELKNLEILSLSGSGVSQLPREIGLLTSIRLLDLSRCSKLEVIPPNVLSSLVKLEALYMGKSFVQWENGGPNIDRTNASLTELKHLSHLITLEIQIRDASILPKDLLFEKLERYRIFVGDVWDWSDKRKTSRELKLKLNTSLQFEGGIKMLLKGIEHLCLDELKGVKSILYELDREGFQQLRHLHVQNNAKIKHIINSRVLAATEIVFPVLEKFSVKNMINLEEICHGKLPPTTFCNLRIVKVEHCDQLKFVFTSSIAKGLSQLQELEIRECSIMGAVIIKEEGDIEDGDIILFPQLHRLALQRLPKLMSFLNTQSSFITDAGEIIHEGRPDFHMPVLHEQVVFPNLEMLDLSYIHSEEILLHNQHRASSSFKLTNIQTNSSGFQNLRNLKVKGSGNLKYLLSSSTARFMVQLKYLDIEDCKVMEEILLTEELEEEEIIPKVLFPQLEVLFLKDLPVLKRFCIGSNIRFPSLTRMKIEKCPKLESFIFKPVSSEEISNTAMQPLFNEKVAFPNLETLIISHMPNLKIIWHEKFSPGSFTKLQSMKVEFCESLINIFQANMLLRFQSLESLHVEDCGSVQEIFELQVQEVMETHAVTVTQLKKLYMHGLPNLKHVWNKDPQGTFSFQNLQDIEVVGCESLKSLFPTSVARRLQQLEKLHIHKCGIEEIIEQEEGAKEDARFVFPKLTILKLYELPKLKWFYQGVHTSEWPLLKTLEVVGSNEIQIFASKYYRIQELDEQGQLETSIQPLFLVEKVAFPSLETLTIMHMENLKIIWHQLAEDSFFELQSLYVKYCENLVNVFNFDILARFQSLERLEVSYCGSLQEVFDLQRHDVRETHAVTAILLKILKLKRLPKMKHVWNKDPQGIFSFQNLQVISVWECESLKSLFPAFVARFLMQLENLRIEDCGVEEIFSSEEIAKASARFVFPKVTILILRKLPKLNWFCRGVHTSEWPLLKELEVSECDQIEIFTSKILNFQETVEQSQLETSIQQPLFLVEEGTLFPNLEVLTLGGNFKMKEIQRDQLLKECFYKLKNLSIVSYLAVSDWINFLKRLHSLEKLFVRLTSWEEIFPYEELFDQENHATILAQLRELELLELPMLTHLWKEDTKPSPVLCYLENLKVSFCDKLNILVPSSVSFQNLTNLEILKCHGLINLVTSSTAKSLIQLKKMSVIGCERITKVVVGEKGEVSEVITFTQLTYLKLDSLPNLASFCSKSYSFNFPSLEEVIVRQCPKMRTFSHGALGTPKLEIVQETQGDEWHWKADLSTTTH